ncbi:hypothetical protein [Nitrobacter sp. JJSN]|uniref:hypothetical protein n=1 Tax=Nitrobacter sp. JJSN TaxID=3453033 RepID=UPI003F772DAB
MSTDTDRLAALVRRYAAGQPLPDMVDGIPLTQWLAGLAHDRMEAPMQLGALLDHPAERPTVAEIAMTFRARLVSAAA